MSVFRHIARFVETTPVSSLRTTLTCPFGVYSLFCSIQLMTRIGINCPGTEELIGGNNLMHLANHDSVYTEAMCTLSYISSDIALCAKAKP